MYHYFVSYTWKDHTTNEYGFGNIKVSLPEQFTHSGHLKDVEKQISEVGNTSHKGAQIVVLN